MFTEKYDYLQYRNFLLNKLKKNSFMCKELTYKSADWLVVVGIFLPFFIRFLKNKGKLARFRLFSPIEN